MPKRRAGFHGGVLGHVVIIEEQLQQDFAIGRIRQHDFVSDGIGDRLVSVERQRIHELDGNLALNALRLL